VLADIDRDAASRREAIASLFKGDRPTLKAVESTEAKPPRSRSKRGDATT
jgi:hypothetical protein